MTNFIAPESGRILLIHLTKGDDLVKSIIDACKENGIVTGVVISGIGSLRRYHYHYIKDTKDVPTDVFEVIEGPLELVALQGLIIEGIPHLHGVVSQAGIKTYSGHFEETGSEVQYLAEIAIQEIKDINIGRRTRENTTIKHLELLN